MKRALIYCRVSSQRQADEGNGLSSQETRCREYCRNKEYIVEKVFADSGISGSVFARPNIVELLKYIDAHPESEFVLVFDDFSRFAREVAVHLQLKVEFKSRGVGIECLNFITDDTAESEFAENIIAAGNDYHRKANKRQVIHRMTSRLKDGFWSFAPPLGYKNIKNISGNRVLTPQEPYATVIKSSFEKFRDGLLQTPNDVRIFMSEELKKHNITHVLALSTVMQILRNPIYAGYLKYDKWNITLREAKHQSIVSYETYCLVQERLEKRSKPWARQDYSNIFPLRHYIKCGDCLTPLTASFNTGRGGKKYPNYFCRGKSCPKRYKVISKYKIEQEFLLLLKHTQPHDLYFDIIKKLMLEQWKEKEKNNASYIESLRKEKEEIEGRIRTYIDRIGYTQDVELVHMYEEEIKKLRSKMIGVEVKLGQRKYTLAEFGTALDKVVSVLKNPIKFWESEYAKDKKIVMQMYFGEEIYYQYEGGFGTGSLACVFNLKGDLSSPNLGNVEMSGSDPESEIY